MAAAHQLGDEFALIERLTSGLRGIGDDCAVLPWTAEQALLVTTDMLLQGRHFDLAWCSPFQVGVRAAEANLSDIAAMAGNPRWAVVALGLPEELALADVEQVYAGLRQRLERWQVELVGGDTTRAAQLTLAVTLLGTAPAKMVRGRGDACPGDALCVSGDLGRAAAGLALLQAGLDDPDGEVTRALLEPRCRLDLVPLLAPRVRALVDLSDGLGSEVRHICQRSDTGAEVWQRALPISQQTRAAATRLEHDALDWALSGGEDFQLLFSATQDSLQQLIAAGADVTRVGTILPPDQGIWLVDEAGQRGELPRGFDHFG